MRKSIVIIFAVAILGLANAYITKHGQAGPHLVPTSKSSASNQAAATSNSTSSPTARYKDGTFSGNVTRTPYGNVQVAAIISGGQITDVQFLQMPSDFNHSSELSRYAEPLLKQTTLSAQNAQSIDFVSGATSTSYGYQASLQAALDQAAVSGASGAGNSSSTAPSNSSQGQPSNPSTGQRFYAPNGDNNGYDN